MTEQAEGLAAQQDSLARFMRVVGRIFGIVMKTREQIGVKTTRCSAILFVAVWALAAWATGLTGAGLGDARAADNLYCGSWALTLPAGWPAWLGVEEDQGQLKASLVWMDGTFGPLPAAKLEDGKLAMSRRPSAPRAWAASAAASRPPSPPRSPAACGRPWRSRWLTAT